MVGLPMPAKHIPAATNAAFDHLPGKPRPLLRRLVARVDSIPAFATILAVALVDLRHHIIVIILLEEGQVGHAAEAQLARLRLDGHILALAVPLGLALIAVATSLQQPIMRDAAHHEAVPFRLRAIRPRWHAPRIEPIRDLRVHGFVLVEHAKPFSVNRLRLRVFLPFRITLGSGRLAVSEDGDRGAAAAVKAAPMSPLDAFGSVPVRPFVVPGGKDGRVLPSGARSVNPIIDRDQTGVMFDAQLAEQMSVNTSHNSAQILGEDQIVPSSFNLVR